MSDSSRRDLYRLDMSGDELRALFAFAVAGREGLTLTSLPPEERPARAIRAAGDVATAETLRGPLRDQIEGLDLQIAQQQRMGLSTAGLEAPHLDSR